MTDISTVKAHADSQPPTVPPYGNPPPPAFTNGSPALEGTIEEEESSTIKCICGFAEDDGNTVLCEKCDSWQHIICYYDSPQHVPDVHECTDCLPRPVDAKGATEKQRLRREQLNNISERKGKPKTTTKSHKKRVKDPLGQVQPNGWAVHSNNDLYYASDRKSGSPRDQPPAKRPKTSHRTSSSVSMISGPPSLVPGSRKRASSTMVNGQSPVKSPVVNGTNGYTLEDFSPEFMQLYRQPEPASIDSNSFTDIGVANEISLWQNDREALAEATSGMQPGQIFERVDDPIEKLDEMAPVILKQTEEDPTITAHGLHPQWHFLTIESFVPKGAYIGELKGCIGRKPDYFSDPANRWDLLKHPEPFVFFPPHLPIYIDTRREGTILRYTRRSCTPNMTMKILTQNVEDGYHFCFVAIEDIQEGDQLTVGWELSSEIQKALETSITNGDIRKEGFKKMEHFTQWVNCVLANFGGCACDHHIKGRVCLFEHARQSSHNHAESTQSLRGAKSKKSKKSQTSPLSTGHATNSRAGSEAFGRDGPDDDNIDSRSTSGSRSKPGSRDMTPMTHFSVEGENKLSDRERRKLAQSERLFEQLEYDEQHGHKRRKRNSAGSSLNTPSLSSSKQLGHSEPSPSALKHNQGTTRKTSGNSSKANGCPRSSKPRPLYVNASTQTEKADDRSSTPMSPSLNKRPMKPPVSLKRRLLQQAQEDRMQRERSQSVKREAASPTLQDVASSKASPAPQQPPSPLQDTAMAEVPDRPVETVVGEAKEPPEDQEPTELAPPPADVEMKDAEESAEAPAEEPAKEPANPTSPKVEEMPDAPTQESETPAISSHPPIQPPAPPWPSLPVVTTSSASDEAPSTTVQSPEKPTNLQLKLPPTPDLSTQTNLLNSATTPGSATGLASGAIVQSPSVSGSLHSPFSPSVANAVNPGPVRKKLSLSDYTRKMKLAQTNSSSSTGTSPPQRQSTSSPTPSASGLPRPDSPSASSTGPLPTVTEEEAAAAAAAPLPRRGPSTVPPSV